MRVAVMTVLSALSILGCDSGSGSTSDASADASADATGMVVQCGQAQGDPSAADCAPSGIVTELGPGGATCRCTLGYHWDGNACVGAGGCACTQNCNKLYPTVEACQAAYTACSRDGG